VVYRPAAVDIGEFVRCLRVLAEKRLTEIEQLARDFLESRRQFEPVKRDELVRRVRSGAVTVLDVRPQEEYLAGHIPQALSVPLDELDRRLSELPKGRPIVAYCRGPYCVLAVEAVRRLRAKGYRAMRLDMGVVDWRARGFRVEGGSPLVGRASRTRDNRGDSDPGD
jgi:rhodanese-related sulfurtransferase